MAWCSGKLGWDWVLLLGFIVLFLRFNKSHSSPSPSPSATGSFSFEIHHRFSEQVKNVLGDHGLPEMATLDFYRTLVHRDRTFRRRRLASNNDEPTLSFAQGNSTQEINFLHYANVTVGTPAQWFLVALDTGSHLFWLPCNCNSTCVRRMETDGGKSIKLNIYDPTNSTSSSKVPCNSSLCEFRNRCVSPSSDCPYTIRYLSPGSKSKGVLVEDVIHLRTEEGSKAEAKDARITFGCSQSQLGLFQQVAVNGIMGLGISDIAVPNMLAKAGVVASDSFSMCFSAKGRGTISFGDSGSSDQLQTPLILTPSTPFYEVSITKFKVGSVTVETGFNAIFDSGTAVTWLLEPYYTSLTTNFHLSVPDKRLPMEEESPLEYCYFETSAFDEEKLPSVSLEMEGGSVYDVFSPIIFGTLDGGRRVYCLAVLKQDEEDLINIIGQNFMTNYRIVHDRERMMLGWKESDCNDESGFRRAEPEGSAEQPSSAPPQPTLIPPNPSTPLNPNYPSSLFFILSSFIMFTIFDSI